MQLVQRWCGLVTQEESKLESSHRTEAEKVAGMKALLDKVNPASEIFGACWLACANNGAERSR